MRYPVTREQAAQVEAAKAAAGVPADVRRSIQREALASQSVNWNQIYYSRVRFQGILQIEPGEIPQVTGICFLPVVRYAFGYQLQHEVDGHPGHNATYADTNLLEDRSTNKGETVEVRGIAIRHTPFTDAYLAQALDMFTSVIIRLDQDNALFPGNPSDIPGSSQVSEGPSWAIMPNTEEDTFKSSFAGTRKATPDQDNMLVLQQPLIWTPKGKDSKLDVQIQLHQQVCHNYKKDRLASVDPFGTNGGPYTFGQGAWSKPKPLDRDIPGMFVDYFVKLYCKVSGPRSVNQ